MQTFEEWWQTIEDDVTLPETIGYPTVTQINELVRSVAKSAYVAGQCAEAEKLSAILARELS